MNRQLRINQVPDYDPKESTRVVYNGIPYTGIREIGFNKMGSFVIDLFTTPFIDDKSLRGGFCCNPPISPKEWRDEHPTSTRAGYQVVSPNHIIIYDDYGTEHSLQIDDEIAVQRLIGECNSQALKVIDKL